MAALLALSVVPVIREILIPPETPGLPLSLTPTDGRRKGA